MQRTYTRANLSQLKQERDQLPEQIPAQQKLIDKLTQEFKQFKKQYGDLIKDQIEPLQDKITILKARIKALHIPAQISSLKSKLDPATEQLSNISADIYQTSESITPLQNAMDEFNKLLRIKNLEADAVKATTAISTSTSLVDEYQLNLNQLRIRKTSLNIQIADLQAQLNSLRAKEQAVTQTSAVGFQSTSVTTSAQGYSTGAMQTSTTTYTTDEAQALAKAISSATNHLHTLNVLRAQLETDEFSQQNKLARQQDLQRQAIQSERTIRTDLSRYSTEEIDKSRRFSYIELNSRLTSLKNQLTPLTSKLSSLKYHETEQLAEVKQYQAQIKQLEEELKRCDNIARSIADRSDLAELQRDVEQQQDLLVPLNKQKQSLKEQVDQAEQVLSDANRKLNEMNSRLNYLTHHSFLTDWFADPASLLSGLADATKSRLTQFDENNPANQSEYERLCIINLQNQFADVIIDKSNKPDIHLYYVRLCGLIHYACDYLKQHHRDSRFVSELEAILSDHPIDSSEAKKEFQSYLTTEIKTPFLKYDDLQAYELNQYQNAQKELQDTIDSLAENKDPNMIKSCQHAKMLIDEIEKSRLAIQQKKSTKHPFDIKLYTLILEKTAHVLNHPKDEEGLICFHRYATLNTAGQTSKAKRIGGIILMILGGLVAIAGLALLPFTLPLFPIIGGLGGAGLIGTGLGLFLSGRQQGVAKQLDKIEHSAQALSA